MASLAKWDQGWVKSVSRKYSPRSGAAGVRASSCPFWKAKELKEALRTINPEGWDVEKGRDLLSCDDRQQSLVAD